MRICHTACAPLTARPAAITVPAASISSATEALQRCRRRVLSWPVPAGLPVTDRGQTPPPLGGGPGVKSVAALLEAADDALPVLDGVGIVVLELGVHPQHRQPEHVSLHYRG